MKHAPKKEATVNDKPAQVRLSQSRDVPRPLVAESLYASDSYARRTSDYVGSGSLGGLIVQLSALALPLCLRETPARERFLNLLVPFNQSWANDAYALVFLVSNSTMRSPRSGNEVPSPTHSFDAGTASGYFALQASLMGWYVHGMVGFDADRPVEQLSVPRGHKVEAVYAVGRIADPAGLPEELRTRDVPSERRSLGELAFEGGFPQ